jgi:hypothetical protein
VAQSSYNSLLNLGFENVILTVEEGLAHAISAQELVDLNTWLSSL